MAAAMFMNSNSLPIALMQSLAAFISDARFAVTTQVSELQKLMIGVKVCHPLFLRSLVHR